MRIEVVRVVDTARGKVEFRCEAGEAVGFWRGELPTPEVGRAIEVELDVPDEVIEYVALDGDADGSLRMDGESVRVIGTVVDVGADGDPVATVRVRGSLVLLEMSDSGGWESAVGTAVAFTASEIRLYPTNL
jgi:hypothetical protein